LWGKNLKFLIWII